MLKYTKQSVIAFDFKDALSFEGETGPYAQYAVVRATSIFRKAGLDADTFGKEVAERFSAADLASFLNADGANEIWELWLAASKTSYIVEQSIATTEPAYLAKHAFQLAQLFNTFYHSNPILSEPDEKRKQFLLATVAVVRRELIRTLGVHGHHSTARHVECAPGAAARLLPIFMEKSISAPAQALPRRHHRGALLSSC